jgi:hypothetical protein
MILENRAQSKESPANYACNETNLINYFSFFIPSLGRAVAQWLRHCATNRNVTGSIPEGVTGIFYWHNPSGHTMALGSTQPLTEMSTINISWG